MQDLLTAISDSVERFLAADQVAAELAEYDFDDRDLLLINNSFIYREKTSIKTTKNENYLAIQCHGESLDPTSPVVVTGININLDWKHLPSKAREELHEQSIEDAVGEELSSLGRILFVLIGEVDDSVVLTRPISSRHYSEIIWDPTSEPLVLLDADTIVVRTAIDEEAIWQEIESLYSDDGDEAPEGLKDPLAIALDKLKDDAVANLVLPEPGDELKGSMIESILRVLREQRQEYDDALSDGTKNDQVPNDVLRIAYNFASDALIFIRLMVSICDLKPIVLWGTLNEHYKLAYALKDLPWRTQNTKPSLKNYYRTIADARNSAFHNLFPFRKSLRVELPEAALQNAALQIFSEHGKKSENELVYQDKELVDLLFEFTRARERNVPMSFWRRNLKVMDASIELCSATRDHLKLLLSVSR